MTDVALPSLGSLVNSARTKQLKTARGILLFVGVMTILVNGVMVFFADSLVQNQIDEELRSPQFAGRQINHQALAEFKQAAVQSTRIADGIAIAAGIVFIVCALNVQRYPVPITIFSLVLYIGLAAAYAVIDPRTLLAGLIVKVIIVIALFKAIQAAISMQREQSLAPLAAEVSPEVPPLAP
jgi:hypothetical protein